MAETLHPRFTARRSTARARTWWGRAWARAAEESAYAEEDLRAGRAMARAGRVGQIAVEAGGFWAAVEESDGVWTVVGAVPVLAEDDRAAFVEVVAAESGRVAALMAGDLPHDLVEHAEEAGVELLPYGGELGSTCTCDAWTDPCPHALAVLSQLAWLVDDDPFVLLHLRGLPREELLARLHERTASPEADPDGGSNGAGAGDGAGDGAGEGSRSAPEDPDLAVAVDAAERARRVLELLEDPDGAGVEHLL